MKKIILFLIFIFLIYVADASEQNYVLNLKYENGIFKFDNLTLAPGGKVKEQFGLYTIKIELLNNTFIEGPSFDTYYYIIKEGIDPKTGDLISEKYIINKTEILLELPYYNNANTIKIYDPLDRIILQIPVSQFSKDLCGDGICQNYESAEGCPSDCKKPAPEEMKMKEKPLEQISETISETASNPWFWVIIASVILIIFIILLISKKKPQETLPIIRPAYPEEM